MQVQYNGHASPGFTDSLGLFAVIEDQFYKVSFSGYMEIIF